MDWLYLRPLNYSSSSKIIYICQSSLSTFKFLPFTTWPFPSHTSQCADKSKRQDGARENTASVGGSCWSLLWHPCFGDWFQLPSDFFFLHSSWLCSLSWRAPNCHGWDILSFRHGLTGPSTGRSEWEDSYSCTNINISNRTSNANITAFEHLYFHDDQYLIN